nr:hypothetical protein [Tanacetum cinerariifolium]
MVMIVHHGSRLSMSRNRATIKTLTKDYHNERIDISYRRECEVMIDELKVTTSPTVKDPEDFLIMGNEELSTIPEKESDEVLENIENKDSYDSNLDALDLLVTPLFDANEYECFDPVGDIDEIDAFLDIDTSTDIKDSYHNSEEDVLYLESLLSDDT